MDPLLLPPPLLPLLLLLLHLTLLWVFFSLPHALAIQTHPHQELTRDELLCVSTSREETALARWLGCLKTPRSLLSAPDSPGEPTIPESEADIPEQPILVDPAKVPDSRDEHIEVPFLESQVSEGAGIPPSESLVDEYPATKFPLLESPSPEDFHHKIQHPETPIFNEDSAPKIVLLGSPFQLQEHGQEEIRNTMGAPNSFSDFNAQERFKPVVVDLGHEKDLPSRGCDRDGDRKLTIEKTRDGEVEGHALSSWLQLNLWLFVLTKCLVAVSRAFKRMGRKSSKLSGARNACLEEDNIAAVCEDKTVKKTEYVHYQSSKWHAKTDYMPTLGSPIGTAVGAVFAEVLLTTSKCGSCVPADKIGMLFKTAFKDSLAVVVGECESLQILDEFMASFRTTYTTICRVHESCLQSMTVSHNKTGEVNSVHQESKVGELCAITGNCINEHKITEILSPKPAKLVEFHSCQKIDSTDASSMMNPEPAKLEEQSRNDNLDLETAKHGESNAHSKSDNLNVTKDARISTEITLPTGMDCGIATAMIDGVELGTSDKKPNPVTLLSEKMESLLLGDDGESTSCGKDACNLVEELIVNQLQGITLNETMCSDNDSIQEDPSPTSLSRNGISSCVIDGISLKDDNLLLTYGTDDVTELDYSSEYASNFCQELSNVKSKTARCSGAMSLVRRNHRGEDHQKSFLSFLERYVQAQEQRNHIKSVEVAHLLKQRVLEEEKIHLTSISNDLMREHIQLNKSKVSFKENTILEQKANSAYASFNTTCADELVAGLFIMLASLVYGVRKYSFTLLSDLVSSCKPIVVKETRRTMGFGVDWLYTSLDSLIGKLQSFICHITVAGRMLIGSIIVAFIASSLLRRSVTSSSQAMPATILIIVLGVVCGFAGKVSVDSLGGNGVKWLVMWELFCMLHALTNCFTPFVYNLLHGSPSNATKWRIGIPFWFRRMFFHLMMVLVLPILAGQLPFGTFGHVMNELLSSSVRGISVIFSTLWEMMSQIAEDTYKP